MKDGVDSFCRLVRIAYCKYGKCHDVGMRWMLNLNDSQQQSYLQVWKRLSLLSDRLES